MNEIYDFSKSVPIKIEFTNRQQIEYAEFILKQSENIIDMPPNNYIHGGIYERELFIPKGTIAVGKVHKCEHIFYLTMGDLSVMTDSGVFRVCAPARFDCLPGIKKMVYAHEDSLCTTFHRTDLTDIDEIEKEIYEESDLKWLEGDKL